MPRQGDSNEHPQDRFFLLSNINKYTSYLNLCFYHMSRDMRKPDLCICENKDADQPRGDREADQRLCLRYTDSTIPLLPKFEISNLLPSSLAVQPGLCRTWSETPNTIFLTSRLICFQIKMVSKTQCKESGLNISVIIVKPWGAPEFKVFFVLFFSTHFLAALLFFFSPSWASSASSSFLVFKSFDLFVASSFCVLFLWHSRICMSRHFARRPSCSQIGQVYVSNWK